MVHEAIAFTAGKPRGRIKMQYQGSHPVQASSLMVVLLIAALAGLGGCATQSTGGPTIKSITADYDAGHFQEAYNAAVTLSRRGDLDMRDQASYLAGLSAYRMQKYLSVDRYLAPLIHAPNPAVAGRAAGTLGLADMERGDFREAATHFKNAADRLKGQEKAEATYRAGLAYREAGLTSQARIQFVIAQGESKDAAFLAKINHELKSNGFTLQLGVFASRANAETMAREFQSTSAATQLGRATIVSGRGDRGELLYYVRVGMFNSYTSALRARDLVDQPAIIHTMESVGE